MMFLSSNTAQPCEGCGLYQPRQLFELLGRQNGTTHAVARSVRIKATSVCPALFVTMFIQTHQIEDTRQQQDRRTDFMKKNFLRCILPICAIIIFWAWDA